MFLSTWLQLPDLMFVNNEETPATRRHARPQPATIRQTKPPDLAGCATMRLGERPRVSEGAAPGTAYSRKARPFAPNRVTAESLPPFALLRASPFSKLRAGPERNARVGVATTKCRIATLNPTGYSQIRDELVNGAVWRTR
jgi:hypothetical protein